MLNVMEGFAYNNPIPAGSDIAAFSGDVLHAIIETMKWATNARAVLADPTSIVGTADVIARLSNKDLAAQIRRFIKNKVLPPEEYRKIFVSLVDVYRSAGATITQLDDYTQYDSNSFGPGTEHTSVIAPDRMGVSVTTTIGPDWGAGFWGSRTGLWFNNQMNFFNWVRNAPPFNLYQPFKRPMSSLTPTILSKNGRLYAVLGGSGAFLTDIISAMMQFTLYTTEMGFNRTLYEGLMMPRVHTVMPWNFSVPNTVLYTAELPNVCIVDMQNRGHNMQQTSWIGEINAAIVNPTNTIVSGDEYEKGAPSGY